MPEKFPRNPEDASSELTHARLMLHSAECRQFIHWADRLGQIMCIVWCMHFMMYCSMPPKCIIDLLICTVTCPPQPLYWITSWFVHITGRVLKGALVSRIRHMTGDFYFSLENLFETGGLADIQLWYFEQCWSSINIWLT